MAGQHADAFEANSGQRPLPAFPGFAFDRHVPHHLATLLRLADDTPVLLRPIAPGDRRRHWRFLCGLSLQTRYQRLMSPRCLLPGELRRMVEIDYRREMALVALAPAGQGSTPPSGHDASERTVEVAVARYVIDDDGDSAEFAMVVTDAWQRRGLGLRLLERLAAVAADAGVRNLGGITLATNTPMIRLARRLGFTISTEPGDWTVKRLTRRLDQPPAAGSASPPADTVAIPSRAASQARRA